MPDIDILQTPVPTGVFPPILRFLPLLGVSSSTLNGNIGQTANRIFRYLAFFICLRVAEASPFLEHKRLEWYGLAFFKFIL
ncbi:hypothetical protein D5074_00755 [Pectobacterium polaris]|nr:hypothetical protein D5074_00755 [Pectobacterium polaris]